MLANSLSHTSREYADLLQSTTPAATTFKKNPTIDNLAAYYVSAIIKEKKDKPVNNPTSFMARLLEELTHNDQLLNQEIDDMPSTESINTTSDDNLQNEPHCLLDMIDRSRRSGLTTSIRQITGTTCSTTIRSQHTTVKPTEHQADCQTPDKTKKKKKTPVTITSSCATTKEI